MYFCQQTITSLILNCSAISKAFIVADIYQKWSKE